MKIIFDVKVVNKKSSGFSPKTAAKKYSFSPDERSIPESDPLASRALKSLMLNIPKLFILPIICIGNILNGKVCKACVIILKRHFSGCNLFVTFAHYAFCSIY